MSDDSWRHLIFVSVLDSSVCVCHMCMQILMLNDMKIEQWGANRKVIPTMQISNTNGDDIFAYLSFSLKGLFCCSI